MSLVKKYWVYIPTFVSAAVVFLTPSLQAYASTHPHKDAAVFILAVLAAFHAQAPKDKQ